MTITAKEIVYESGGHWVRRVKRSHYEVYRHTSTHSVRVATVAFADDAESLKRAIAECDRREAA